MSGWPQRGLPPLPPARAPEPDAGSPSPLLFPPEEGPEEEAELEESPLEELPLEESSLEDSSLEELSLRGHVSIPGDHLLTVLRCCPNLHRLDVSCWYGRFPYN